jgi:hypothetical protein
MTIAFLSFVIAACILCAVYCEWTIRSLKKRANRQHPLRHFDW